MSENTRNVMEATPQFRGPYFCSLKTSSFYEYTHANANGPMSQHGIKRLPKANP